MPRDRSGLPASGLLGARGGIFPAEGPAVGEVAPEVGPATQFGEGVVGVAPKVGQCVDPLAPEAIGSGEAIRVVGAEAGVETEQGTEAGVLVVAQVGAR